MPALTPTRKVVKKDVCGTLSSRSMGNHRLEEHLYRWAIKQDWWSFERWYPKRSAGFIARPVFGDIEGMTEATEQWVISIVDQLVEDVRKKDPAAHSALLIHFGMSRIVRFPRENEQECLARGREYVRSGLEAWGIY